MAKQSAYFIVRDAHDKHDVKALKNGLDELKGVLSVSVNADQSRIAVDYDSTGVQQGQIARKICKLGYDIMEDHNQAHIM
ncbi:heavy-metal-associated domain-containing protein [Candidatus Soleaferrea massiliensis]|uniref:heavy-metal-associated domain-containing protein n=1 Tax=Candidatus Soleaferrea massiliensis TaxID=1470354 RepID=UPI00058F37A5|nr:heavy-metal-associated domain-containing protein [Candidatus Soleaferrea massiliensis]